MIQKKREIGIASELKVRQADDGTTGRTVEGYALKFGVRSVMLCDWYENYVEILEPGCLTRAVLDTQDIKLTMFHSSKLVLGRSNKGTGTLSYDVDSEGVRFWAEMPRTVDGEKALELVRRGDIAGCSFAYSTDEADEKAVSYEHVTEEGKEILVRHVWRIDRVYDFTLTTDPAYQQTTVSRREVEDKGVKLEGCGEKDPKEKEGTQQGPEMKEQECDPEKKKDALRSLRNAAGRRI